MELDPAEGEETNDGLYDGLQTQDCQTRIGPDLIDYHVQLNLKQS